MCGNDQLVSPSLVAIFMNGPRSSLSNEALLPPAPDQ